MDRWYFQVSWRCLLGWYASIPVVWLEMECRSRFVAQYKWRLRWPILTLGLNRDLAYGCKARIYWWLLGYRRCIRCRLRLRTSQKDILDGGPQQDWHICPLTLHDGYPCHSDCRWQPTILVWRLDKHYVRISWSGWRSLATNSREGRREALRKFRNDGGWLDGTRRLDADWRTLLRHPTRWRKRWWALGLHGQQVGHELYDYGL